MITVTGSGRSPSGINIETDNAVVLVDPVDDAIGAAPGVTTGERLAFLA
jgi:hypothetical protein